MDDAKRKLAECWRDLAGDHEGMVWVNLVLGIRQVSGSVPEPRDSSCLPDPNASPNLGVWLVWVATKVDPAPVDLQASEPGWSACIRPCATHEPERFADALLRAYVEWSEEQGSLPDLPPSVQAWWAEQQEESR